MIGKVAVAIFTAALGLYVSSSVAAEQSQDKTRSLDQEARAALGDLYAKVPAAKALGAESVAILVFPGVTKAGLVVGGQHGQGALLRKGKTVGYYSTSGISYGLQAGAQRYGYAMFFMSEAALKQLDKADGFEVGVGPSVVVIDEGAAKSVTTTTMKEDIYAFVFGQKGLMAGIGIQGNRIARIDPSK
jgi:lipid-binding SYLF domain-containing protein